jgi:hypothetical protein
MFIVLSVAVASAYMNIQFLLLNWDWLSLYEKSMHGLGSVASLMLAGVYVAYLELPKTNTPADSKKKTVKKVSKKKIAKKK